MSNKENKKDNNQEANTQNEGCACGCCEETQTEEAVAEEIVEEVPQTKEEELQKECDTLKDTAKRIQAEFENYKKRTVYEGKAQYDRGVSTSISAILPVLDSMERAVGSMNTDEEKEGYNKIYKQFIDILSSQNVKQMECMDKAFDPNMHEAMMEQEIEGKQSGTILSVYTNGYTLDDKVIRHAQVIVAK